MPKTKALPSYVLFTVVDRGESDVYLGAKFAEFEVTSSIPKGEVSHERVSQLCASMLVAVMQEMSGDIPPKKVML